MYPRRENKSKGENVEDKRKEKSRERRKESGWEVVGGRVVKLGSKSR